MITLSIIKADTGGFVGHSCVALVLTHKHGNEHPRVHGFAWDVFLATTAIAKRLGLYGAGQDLLSDAFSGNLRGAGPGYAELEYTTMSGLEKRPADRWEPLPARAQQPQPPAPPAVRPKAVPVGS